MAHAGLEPATFALLARRSNRANRPVGLTFLKYFFYQLIRPDFEPIFFMDIIIPISTFSVVKS